MAIGLPLFIVFPTIPSPQTYRARSRCSAVYPAATAMRISRVASSGRKMAARSKPRKLCRVRRAMPSARSRFWVEVRIFATSWMAAISAFSGGRVSVTGRL
jgi:hypothetical protein